MELIEVLVQELLKAGASQVWITTKFVEITQTNLDELGFDWMLGQFNAPGSNRIFGGGGTLGNQAEVSHQEMITLLCRQVVERLQCQQAGSP